MTQSLKSNTQEHQTGEGKEICDGHYRLRVHSNRSVKEHNEVEHLYV